MTKLWSYEVRAKTGDYNNVATSGTDVAESGHPDVATLLHNITTFEVGFGWILAHSKPIMKGFKAQTRGIENEEDL